MIKEWKEAKKWKESEIIDLTDDSSPTAGLSTLQSHAALIQSPSDSHEDISQLMGVTWVTHFLNVCFPPMAHFLQHFIDFGYTGKEHLFVVSTWSSEEISQFLSKISAYGSNKCKFSDMDMLILHNHFISYFTKAQTWLYRSAMYDQL